MNKEKAILTDFAVSTVAIWKASIVLPVQVGSFSPAPSSHNAQLAPRGPAPSLPPPPGADVRNPPASSVISTAAPDTSRIQASASDCWLIL